MRYCVFKIKWWLLAKLTNTWVNILLFDIMKQILQQWTMSKLTVKRAAMIPNRVQLQENPKAFFILLSDFTHYLRLTPQWTSCDIQQQYLNTVNIRIRDCPNYLYWCQWVPPSIWHNVKHQRNTHLQ